MGGSCYEPNRRAGRTCEDCLCRRRDAADVGVDAGGVLSIKVEQVAGDGAGWGDVASG